MSLHLVISTSLSELHFQTLFLSLWCTVDSLLFRFTWQNFSRSRQEPHVTEFSNAHPMQQSGYLPLWIQPSYFRPSPFEIHSVIRIHCNSYIQSMMGHPQVADSSESGLMVDKTKVHNSASTTWSRLTLWWFDWTKLKYVGVKMPKMHSPHLTILRAPFY